VPGARDVRRAGQQPDAGALQPELHNFDPVTPAEETLRVLDDLVTAGKVRCIGFSDTPAWATAEAATIARFRGWAPVIALHLEYSLLERTSEGELVPLAQSMGMGVLPWSPLKSGFLSGKYSSGATGPADTTRQALFGVPGAEDYRVIDTVNDIAAGIGVSPAAVALAWVQGRPGITSTLIGARRMDQLEANLGALDLTLSAEHEARLTEVSAPRLNFPAANNAGLARLAQNGGTTVDGVPTPVPPRLVQGTRVY
jgi:aryl-alcohol dehydrogenase-like predicted oxidoreductase